MEREDSGCAEGKGFHPLLEHSTAWLDAGLGRESFDVELQQVQHAFARYCVSKRENFRPIQSGNLLILLVP
jgi:hypothetical protein